MAHLFPKKLSVALCAVFATGLAHAEVVTTDEVNVSAGTITENAPASTVVSRKRIDREMIRDMRDLTRYEQDLGLQEEGRYDKGFTMRGVEGNRVGILIDGMSMPDFEDNTLYARYGYMNTSRPTVDPELVSSIGIDRGSNSVNTGSGAVGGSVMFNTLRPEDVVEEGKEFGALGRIGYATKNREWLKTVSAAWNTDSWTALALYSHRYGHETKSLGEGPEYYESKAQHPNPTKKTTHSYLLKLRKRFNDEHSVGLNVNGSKMNREMDARNVYDFQNWAFANDTTERHQGTLDYTYAPYGDYLNKVKVYGEALWVDTQAVTTLLDSGWMGWNQGEIDDNKDRRFNTKVGRLTMEAQSAPIELFGEHNFEGRVFASVKDFKNINEDYLGGATSVYTIQRPMRTVDKGIVLSDNIFFHPELIDGHDTTVAVRLGTRLEHSKIKPQPLNAPCSHACQQIDPKVIVPKSFLNKAFSLGIDVEMDHQYKVGYNIATGFRNPGATELYFSFFNWSGTWLPNPNLTSEKSLTQNLFVQVDNRIGHLNVNAYKIDYKDFLFESEGNRVVYDAGGGMRNVWTMMMVNQESAYLHGVEASGALNLDIFNQKLKGAKLVGSVGYAKGRTNDDLGLLAVQPLKVIFGLDYEHPSKTYGIYARGTYLGEKKARDTIRVNDDWRIPSPTAPTKWRNKAAYVFDLFGWYSPKKNVTIRAGVYNIMNKRYQTWDALRGINQNSKSAKLDTKALGLERYYAPGRNYNVTLEVKF